MYYFFFSVACVLNSKTTISILFYINQINVWNDFLLAQMNTGKYNNNLEEDVNLIQVENI